jgi:hypothetical protein
MESNASQTPSTPRRFRAGRLLRDWRFWLLAVVALYTLVGFVLVPFVAKQQIASQVRKALGCEASVASARFNPYTFNSKLAGFVLLDRGGDTLATFDELHVNFAPWPLRKRVVALEEVRLTAPSLAVRVRDDGALNLLDLVPDTTAATAAEPKKPAQPWLVRLDRLGVDGMTVTLDDATVVPPAHADIDSLSLSIASFLSQPGDTAQFALRFVTRRGGAVRAQGFALPLDGVVETRVDVDSLALPVAAPYLARVAYLDLRSGRLAVHGDVHVVAAPDSLPDVHFQGDIVVDDLALFDTLKSQDFFGFDRLAIL